MTTCAAARGAKELCAANTANGVALVEGSTSCVLGRTWGYDRNGIWVSDDCQGTFVLSARGGLVCASDGARQRCPADTSAGVVLARSIETAACVLGQTWGYEAARVWVDKGCVGEFVLGEVDASGNPASDLDRFLGLFNPYGRFLGHVAFFNDEVEVQDNVSWLGLAFSTRGPVKIFAGTEWAVNLMRGGQQFNASGNTSGGFPELIDSQADQVLSNRLGYVGVDFGPFGRVTVGKQWGVHTDVSLYTTERSNVFGSEASATYTAGTDGGPTGTGRADQAITYRAKLVNILQLGAQVQFRTAANGRLVDGFGASAQIEVVPGGRIGAAYTKANYADDVKALTPGLDGEGEFGVIGARFERGGAEAGVVFARQRNGDLARIVLLRRSASRGRVQCVRSGNVRAPYASSILGLWRHGQLRGGRFRSGRPRLSHPLCVRGRRVRHCRIHLRVCRSPPLRRQCWTARRHDRVQRADRWSPLWLQLQRVSSAVAASSLGRLLTRSRLVASRSTTARRHDVLCTARSQQPNVSNHPPPIR
jgi:hypothetical protein